MNEYEQCLFDHIIINKLDAVLSRSDYQQLSRQRIELEKKLEDAITGEQSRLLRRCMEVTTQMTNLELELVFRETLILARSLRLG